MTIMMFVFAVIFGVSAVFTLNYFIDRYIGMKVAKSVGEGLSEGIKEINGGKK